MSDHWTFHKVAEELLRIIPNLGRFMEQYVQSTGAEDATMMQVGTLFHLLEHPATVSDLAKRRKVSLQSASVHVQSLVERGWVVRLPDPHDRRRSLLQATPQGVARAEAAKAEMVDYMSEVLRGLTAEEIAAAQVFLPALKRIVLEHGGSRVMLEPHNKGGEHP